MTHLTEEGVSPALCFTNRQGLVTDAMIGGHLGHSDHEIIRLISQRGRDKYQKNCYSLDSQKVSFSLFRRLVERVPRGTVLKSKEVQEDCTFVKKEILMV